MPQLLNFPGKSGEINILEKMGTNYKTFGIHLLKDETGVKIDSIAKEEGESIHISMKNPVKMVARGRHAASNVEHNN